MILESASSPLSVRLVTTMLGKKASLAPLLALLRSDDVKMMALSSLPEREYSHFLDYMLAGSLISRSNDSNSSDVSCSSAVDNNHYFDIFYDTLRSIHLNKSSTTTTTTTSTTTTNQLKQVTIAPNHRILYPLIWQYEYKQGKQTRWALAWSFVPEICVAAAKFKLQHFRHFLQGN